MKPHTVISLIFTLILLVAGVVGTFGVYVDSVRTYFTASPIMGWLSIAAPILAIIALCLFFALLDNEDSGK
jgi:hypothetical protein